MMDKRIKKIFSRLEKENAFMSRFKENIFYSNYVFICGGNLENYTSRETLLEVFKNYNCLISEKLDELTNGLDLLTFERVIEAISQVIVISLESFGTACELGAFTYLTGPNKTMNREIVIFDEKHKDDDSFINKGPIKLLTDLGDNRVIYTSYSPYKDGKSMIENAEIRNLVNHNLVLNNRPMTTFYSKKRRISFATIKDLSSFFAYLTDAFSFFGFCDSEMLLDFIYLTLGVKNIILESNGFESADNLQQIIDCFLKIMERLGILEKTGKYYFTKSEKIVDRLDSCKKNVGSLIFKSRFLKSKKCTIFKSDFIQLRRKLYAD